MGMSVGKKIRRRVVVHNEYLREFISELIGTFLLLFVGLGANAMATLEPRLNSYFAVNLAWGFSLSFAVWTSGGISGGHVNPTVSLGMAAVGQLRWIKVPVYWLAQYLGAFLSSVCVYCIYYDAINHFDGGHRTVFGQNATAGIFATYPQPYLSPGIGFIDQVVGTMLLLFFIMALTDSNNLAPHPSIFPLCVGFVLTVIGMSFGTNGGYAINPARDLSPRIFTAIAGWGSQVFTAYNYWFWIPLVAPHLGALLGVGLYFLAIGVQIPAKPTTDRELGENDEDIQQLPPITNKSNLDDDIDIEKAETLRVGGELRRKSEFWR